MTGDVIAGRFTLCDPIGSGGSGTVWRAFDGKRRGYCAAKLLRQRDAGDLLRFVREQSVRLDHPHIVSPYGWVAEDGAVLIASELVTGGSLHTLIGDYGPFAESTVVTVLRQLLAGLQAVHVAELIHRDVKPANLLLRASGTGPLRVVLTDFGLTISRLDARLTQVGTVIGTPGFVPPEVLMGGIPPDPRHDLFATGRLAVTMLAGAEPGVQPHQVIGCINDPTLRAAVEALLRHDPAERPVDARAAIDLLADLPAELEPRSRDGDRIDVLDQLPELPDGWGPDGPADPAVSGPPRVPPRATIVDVGPTAPAPIPGHLPMPADQQLDRPALTAGSNMILPSALPITADRHPTRRKGPMLAAAAVAAVLVAGLVLVLWLLPDASTGDPSQPPTSTSPGSIGTTPVSVTQESATVPGTATIGPTATAAVTPENLSTGDACRWQQEGDRRTGVDGAALVCALDAGIYQWRSPG